MAGSYEVRLFTALSVVYCMIIPGHGFIKISPYLHSCSRSSPDLNSCVKNALSTLVRNLKTGSPELSIPALDPMIISHVESDYEDEVFSLIESFNNVFMFGFCNIQFDTVKVSLQQDKLEITSKIPMLSFQGHYKGDGEVINYPMGGFGAFEVNLTDVTSMWIIYFKRTPLNGTMYLQVDDFSWELLPLEVDINVAERNDGGNSLNEEDKLNSILNESSSELFIHFKPKMMTILTDIFVKLINNVLLQFPESVILPQ